MIPYGISLGSIEEALPITRNLGLSAVQVFTADPQKFDSSFDSVKGLKSFVENYLDITLVSHSSLMTNLVSEKDKTRIYSINSLCMEMIRCNILNISTAVFHPGSCISNGPQLLAESVNAAISKSINKGWAVIENICIENMVDSGNHIMISPKDFAEFFALVPDRRVKICLDTCHCWGAGFSPKEFIEGLKSFGIEDRLKVIHFNNSQVDKGCHKERHAELFKEKFDGKISLNDIYWLFDYLKSREDIILIEEQPKECDVVKISEDLIKAINGVRIIKEENKKKGRSSMITLSGTSLISINLSALGEFLNSFISEGQLPSFSIKFDGRPNVKSTFLKLDESSATIYTGAVLSEGLKRFTSDEGVSSDFDVLMFLVLFVLKKAIKKETYELKVSDSSLSYARMDDDFDKTSKQVQILIKKFLEIYPDGSTVSPVKKSSETSVKVSGNPNKYVPLVDTPKVEIPEDLDLLSV